MRLPEPRTPDPMEAPALRWGILGPGGIATGFAQALQARTRQVIVAAGSRDPDRARAFTDRFGGRPHASYAALVADDEVDIVYVATPHSAHLEHALLAIEAGRHVLVEKAFARNEAEAAQIFAAARARGVFCMEAMWSRFLPHYDVIRRSVEEGLLGQLSMIIADHGQLLYPDGPRRLADPALAGGALLDLGIYPVSFAAMLMPGPLDVHAHGRLTERGVDAEETITLREAGGAFASCTTTMIARTANTAVVAGDRARLEVAGWFYQPNRVRLVDTEDEVLAAYTGADHTHGLAYEAAAAARSVVAGQLENPLMPSAETLRVLEVCDRIRGQLGVRYPGE